MRTQRLIVTSLLVALGVGASTGCVAPGYGVRVAYPTMAVAVAGQGVWVATNAGNPTYLADNAYGYQSADTWSNSLAWGGPWPQFQFTLVPRHATRR